ncbi:gibberellin-regulated protein 14-like [Durio zibethinus]|uniref:Gibberellin-regulated protein 14-like n=1 Tax=Durio zibethinus TaxID=66656 RepID=A0A6P5ZGD2_DURZI|nr:gibberellin-regulated protein 14-like [Durio zibethinus]
MKSLKIQLADLQNQFRQKQQQQQAASSYNIFTPYHTGMHDTLYQAYTLPPFQPYNPPTSPPKPFFTPFQYKLPPTSIPTSSQPTQYFTPISDQPEQPSFVDPKPKRVAEQPLFQPSKPKPSSSSIPQNPTPQPNQKSVQLMISPTQTLPDILPQMA